MTELTRGKPRVASHEAVEDEDEVEADVFDAVVGEAVRVKVMS